MQDQGQPYLEGVKFNVGQFSQSPHASTCQPVRAHSCPLKDAACSHVRCFHGAIFSRFLSQALPPLFTHPWASETNWPFSCSSKLCSLSWEPFWLKSQPIWVCLTAGMFSNSMGACFSLAFCFLQHSEIINKQWTENKRSLKSTADGVGCSISVLGSSFILWSWGSSAASFPPSLYLPCLFRHWIPHVRTCLWHICTVPRSNELQFLMCIPGPTLQ